MSGHVVGEQDAAGLNHIGSRQGNAEGAVASDIRRVVEPQGVDGAGVLSAVADHIHIGIDRPVICQRAGEGTSVRVSRQAADELVDGAGGGGSVLVNVAVSGPTGAAHRGPTAKNAVDVAGVGAGNIIRAEVNRGTGRATNAVQTQFIEATAAEDAVGTGIERDTGDDLEMIVSPHT